MRYNFKILFPSIYPVLLFIYQFTILFPHFEMIELFGFKFFSPYRVNGLGDYTRKDVNKPLSGKKKKKGDICTPNDLRTVFRGKS